MIKLILGDITTMAVDAIVNAANTSLLGGGGVDGAIHRAGGKAISDECEKIRQRQGGCKVGKAVITSAGAMPARYVIHTVGPVWHGGIHKEDLLLASAYHNSLQLAAEHDVKTIAFPNISTGVYHFPKEQAAEIAIKTVQNFLQAAPQMDVIFVCFDQENYDIYKKLM